MQTFYEVDVIRPCLNMVSQLGWRPGIWSSAPLVTDWSMTPTQTMQQTGPDTGQTLQPPDQQQYYLLGPCYHLVKQNNKKRTSRKEVGCLVETCNSRMKLENIEV